MQARGHLVSFLTAVAACSEPVPWELPPETGAVAWELGEERSPLLALTASGFRSFEMPEGSEVSAFAQSDLDAALPGWGTLPPEPLEPAPACGPRLPVPRARAVVMGESLMPVEGTRALVHPEQLRCPDLVSPPDAESSLRLWASCGLLAALPAAGPSVDRCRVDATDGELEVRAYPRTGDVCIRSGGTEAFLPCVQSEPLRSDLLVAQGCERLEEGGSCRFEVQRQQPPLQGRPTTWIKIVPGRRDEAFTLSRPNLRGSDRRKGWVHDAVLGPDGDLWVSAAASFQQDLNCGMAGLGAGETEVVRLRADDGIREMSRLRVQAHCLDFLHPEADGSFSGVRPRAVVDGDSTLLGTFEWIRFDEDGEVTERRPFELPGFESDSELRAFMATSGSNCCGSWLAFTHRRSSFQRQPSVWCLDEDGTDGFTVRKIPFVSEFPQENPLDLFSFGPIEKGPSGWNVVLNRPERDFSSAWFFRTDGCQPEFTEVDHFLLPTVRLPYVAISEVLDPFPGREGLGMTTSFELGAVMVLEDGELQVSAHPSLNFELGSAVRWDEERLLLAGIEPSVTQDGANVALSVTMEIFNTRDFVMEWATWTDPDVDRFPTRLLRSGDSIWAVMGWTAEVLHVEAPPL